MATIVSLLISGGNGALCLCLTCKSLEPMTSGS